MNGHRQRLEGAVIIAIPVSWQTICYLIFSSLIIAFVFLSLATYSRVETVNGTIIPDKGVSTIVPSRNGVISSLSVHDGQDVPAGMELAAIRAEEDSTNHLSAAEQVEVAVSRQDASLVTQTNAAKAAADAQPAVVAYRVVRRSNRHGAGRRVSSGGVNPRRHHTHANAI